MCGIVGLIGPKGKNISVELYTALCQLQHRGQDSCGFFIYEPGTKREPYYRKRLGLIAEGFGDNSLVDVIGNFGIAQVRYPTVGRVDDAERFRDAQPTYVSTPGFAMAHNGNIINVDELREESREKRRYPTSNCDVEVVNLVLAEEISRLTNSGKITKEVLFEGTKKAMEKLSGSYSVISIIQDIGFFVFRDPHSIRPLIMGTKEDGSIGFASESVALNKIGYDIVRDIKGGEAILIPEDGTNLESRLLFGETSSAHCMFSLVYFARPASILDGVDVYQTRFKLGVEMGRELLNNNPNLVKEIDKVVPIPDTPRPIAAGLAEIIKKPCREVFDKDRYMARSFINPEQISREKTIFGKLTPILSEIKDAVIFVVDDSNIRGNTGRRVVKLLRDAGAKKVHYGFGCSQVKWPCHLGIDMPTYEELVAHNRTLDQISEYIGADSVTYLSVDGLKRVIGSCRVDNDSSKKEGYCFGCVDGDYPIPCSTSFSERRKKDRQKLE